MQSNSAFLGEQIILPASLRRPLPKLDCSRVDTAVQPPFLHSQRSKDDLSSLEDNEEDTDGSLNVLAKDKIEILCQLKLRQRETRESKAELENAQRLQEKLRQHLAAKVRQLHSIRKQIESLETIISQFKNETTELKALYETSQVRIQDLKKIALLKDEELTSLRNAHSMLKEKLCSDIESRRQLECKVNTAEQEKESISAQLRSTMTALKNAQHEVERLKEQSQTTQIQEQKKASVTQAALRHQLEQLKVANHELTRHNRFLMQRNQDLVEAYWPIMTKLKSMECTHTISPVD